MNTESLESSIPFDSEEIELTIPLSEQPFHQLIEKDVNKMNDQELRDLLATLKEERVSPAVRAAKKRREASAIATGKSRVKVNFNDFL